MSKQSAYFYANGKRKTAVATVRLYPQGSGEIAINDKKLREWAMDESMVRMILSPLEILGLKKSVDLNIITRGGGKKAQTEAIRLGIARACEKKDGQSRTPLKQEGLLTRDSRVKERKKPGLLSARRSPQWSKR